MNRSEIRDAGSVNNNFRNSATNGDILKPPDTGERDVSIPVTNVEILPVDVKPKDPDGYVNSDDVNLMKRTTVDEVNKADDKPDHRGGTRLRKPPTYAAKKTVAQGMMDIALITSNANQLRNLIAYQTDPFSLYFVSLLIVVSLLLQILVGVFLIFKGRFDAKGKDKAAAARVNNQIMAAVFLITIINIFIAAFGIPQNTPPNISPNTPPNISPNIPPNTNSNI